MMRSLILAFALSTSLVALSSVPALAQTTDQTDQSEEDWRKSRKKRDTSDIFEDIKNSGVFGSGTMQGPPTPIESLPEDSRRHLMKERARVIATTENGQTPDAPYNPSEEAKTDPDLAEQEKEAWDIIMTDLKGGSGQGQPGNGPNKVAIAGQGGSGSPSNSTMRGGSTQSVAEILAQIKGLKSGSLGGGSGTQDSGGGSGQGPLGTGGSSGQTGQQAGQQAGGQSQGQSQGQDQGQGQQAGAQNGAQGQSQQGQGQQGQGQDGQAQQASTQNGAQSQNQSDQNGQSGSASDSSSDSNSDASAQSDASSDSASADAAQAAAQARAEAIAEAEAKAHAPEPIGPLDRIKKDRASNGVGSNTSASDFLKKKKD